MPVGNEKIESHHQAFDVGEIIELYELDLLHLDGTILRFTDGVESDGNAILFGGNMYLPLPVEAQGFELSANAQFPRPTLRVANVNNSITSLLLAYNNLLGIKLTRIRTYSKFLDSGADPDVGATLVAQKWQIERKIGQNRMFVEFELSSAIDAANARLPGRTIHKNGCPLIYRVFDTNNGVFIQGTCPYAGSNFFKVNDESTSQESEDLCGKRIDSCKLRFGATAELPYAAYPGTGAVR